MMLYDWLCLMVQMLSSCWLMAPCPHVISSCPMHCSAPPPPGHVDPSKAAVDNLSVEAYAGGKDAYNAPASVFDSTTHCLHGVIHTNGYGHLVRVNGRDGAAATAAAMATAVEEGGASPKAAATAAAVAAAAAAAAASANTGLAGPELMMVWDTLCATLRAKEVSGHAPVRDGSRSSLYLRYRRRVCRRTACHTLTPGARACPSCAVYHTPPPTPKLRGCSV